MRATDAALVAKWEKRLEKAGMPATMPRDERLVSYGKILNGNFGQVGLLENGYTSGLGDCTVCGKELRDVRAKTCGGACRVTLHRLRAKLRAS